MKKVGTMDLVFYTFSSRSRMIRLEMDEFSLSGISSDDDSGDGLARVPFVLFRLFSSLSRANPPMKHGRNGTRRPSRCLDEDPKAQPGDTRSNCCRLFSGTLVNLWLIYG